MTAQQEDRQREREFTLSYKRLDLIGTAVQQLIRGGCLVAIAGFAYLSIKVLAGKSTFAEIALRAAANLKIGDLILLLVGTGGVGYGINQRRLRRSNVERLSKRVQELESALDPKRSTSGLTPQGTTRPGDKAWG